MKYYIAVIMIICSIASCNKARNPKDTPALQDIPVRVDVSPDGGDFVLENGILLSVPANAVPSGVTLTLQPTFTEKKTPLIHDPDVERTFVCGFYGEPHDVTFSSAVTVSLPPDIEITASTSLLHYKITEGTSTELTLAESTTTYNTATGRIEFAVIGFSDNAAVATDYEKEIALLEKHEAEGTIAHNVMFVQIGVLLRQWCNNYIVQLVKSADSLSQWQDVILKVKSWVQAGIEKYPDSSDRDLTKADETFTLMLNEITGAFPSDYSRGLDINTLAMMSDPENAANLCENRNESKAWTDVYTNIQGLGGQIEQNMSNVVNLNMFHSLYLDIMAIPESSSLNLKIGESKSVRTKIANPCDLTVDLYTQTMTQMDWITYYWEIVDGADYLQMTPSDGNIGCTIKGLKSGTALLRVNVKYNDKEKRLITRQVTVGDTSSYISHTMKFNCSGGTQADEKFTKGFGKISEPSAYYDSAKQIMTIIAYDSENKYILFNVYTLPVASTTYDKTNTSTYYQTYTGFTTSWKTVKGDDPESVCTHENTCVDIPDDFGGWTQDCTDHYNVCCSGANSASITFTGVGEVGGMVEGTFAIEMPQRDERQCPIVFTNGKFNVKRVATDVTP